MTTPPASQESDRRERPLRVVVMAVCLVVGLTALWGIVDALRVEPRVWGLLGFEVVTVITAALGVMVGLGKPKDAPGLATACLGATVFAAGTLGRFSAIVTRADDTISEGQALRLLVRDPMFDARLAAAVLLGAIAMCLILGSDRTAWKKLLIGSGLLVPSVGLMGWVAGPGRDWLLAPVESTGGMVRVVVGLVGGVVLTIIASIAVHLVIRAFAVRLPPMAAATSPKPRKTAEATPNKTA